MTAGPDAPARVEAVAPAKVNLALHVTGRRADGYHDLDSLVVFAGVGDRVVVEDAAARRLTLTGPFAEGVPTGSDNLVWRAADLLDPHRPVSIAVHKSLPHGAGLGGGSADAGAVLHALCALWGTEMPDPQALARIGSDVPVCAHGRPARMRGIGAALSPVLPIPPLWLVLLREAPAVSTAAAFAALTHRCNPPLEPPDWHDTESFLAWLGRQRNDLEPAAGTLTQGLGAGRALLLQAGARVVRLSGSGSAQWGIFDDADAARAAAASLSKGAPAHRWVAAAPILG